LISSLPQRPSREITIEQEPPRGVCRLSVHLRASFVAPTPQKLNESKRLRIARQGTPGQCIDDPPADRPNGKKRSHGDLIGAGATAEEFAVTAQGNCQDEDAIIWNGQHQPGIEANSDIVIEVNEIAAGIEESEEGISERSLSCALSFKVDFHRRTRCAREPEKIHVTDRLS
jgi:hypothetical protein